MNEERDKIAAESNEEVSVPTVEETPESPPVELPIEFTAAKASRPPKWDSGSKPGTWTTIGCGMGIVLLVAALFAGSSLMKRTVWTGFSGARQRVVANLEGDVPPGERMALIRDLDRFAAQLENHPDPYPIMGDFQKRVRAALEDERITRDEAAELNAFLEEHLPSGPSEVPYSMP